MRTLTSRQRRLLRKVDRQLRASAQPRVDAADGELNIVPFLDVVVNLVMFLLMTVTATLALAQVPSEVAEVRDASVTPRSHSDRVPAVPPLVHLGEDGVHVFAHDRRLAPGCTATGDAAVTVPRVAREHDWLALRGCADVLRRELGDGQRVDLSATADTPYDEVIHAMDALRGPVGAPLFSDVRWVAPGTAR
jgi:biopolymer transport protein TolR